MKHADEGQLHAYLDGELSPDEVTELERHISVCTTCRALLTEARGFLTESDRLVLALDVPLVARPQRTPRRIPYSTLAWAAMVVLALGTGYALRPALGPRNAAVVVGEAPGPVGDVATVVPPPATTTAAAPAPRPQRQAPPVPGKAANAPSTDLASAGGAGVSNEAAGRAAQRERNDEASITAPTTPARPAPAPGASAQAPSRFTYIDGTPVDSTTTRLNFGPRGDAAPKRITLDEAVTRLGGTIRLIDGLAPQRVEVLSGVDVMGADPDREVVRVYYEEPDLGLITLDQQRPAPSFAARDSRSRDAQSAAPPEAFSVNPAPQPSASGALLRGAVATNSVSWRTDGVWLSLTSRLQGEALSKLQARVK